MKKMMFCLLALVVGGDMLRAQYFEGTHGTTVNEVLESGINASPMGSPFFPGHIMTGYTDMMGPSSVTVMRTDPAGITTSGPPYFNNFIQYAIGGSPIDTKGRRVLNYTVTGDQILVWGDYCTAAAGVSDRFFLLLLSADGNTIFYTQDYQLPGPPPFEVRATSISKSNMFPGTVYVCGWVQQVAGGPREPIAMSIDGTTGVPYWSQLYSVTTSPAGGDWIVNDLEESMAVGYFSLALVGHVVSKVGPKFAPVISHASFNTVDPLTGVPTSAVQIYGGFNSESSFEAINVAYGYTGGMPGFVVAGWQWSWTGMNNDMIAMRFDPAGMGIDFTTMIEYSQYPAPNEAYDVIERYSTASAAYEYYLGGKIFNDAGVIKLDANGNPVANSEWVYGGTGTDVAMQLDYYEMPTDSSLSIFGTTNSLPLSTGGQDFYQLKAYFNGYLSSSCVVTMANPSYTIAGGFLTQYNVMPQPGPNPIIPLVPWSMGNQADLIACSGSDVNGNNTRQLQPQAMGMQQPFLYPNPISRANPVLNLQLAPFAGTVHLDLRNALGQQVMEKEEQLGEGQSTLQLDLGKFEAGVYLLSVNHSGNLTTHRIIIE